nr:uncharacterized protein CTRU02_06682 [Colletotrichum truncatum]KAF6792599.1 hypothetical protein CTRU02_06682 [Colletotrichum truncatum]
MQAEHTSADTRGTVRATNWQGSPLIPLPNPLFPSPAPWIVGHVGHGVAEHDSDRRNIP